MSEVTTWMLFILSDNSVPLTLRRIVRPADSTAEIKPYAFTVSCQASMLSKTHSLFFSGVNFNPLFALLYHTVYWLLTGDTKTRSDSQRTVC